MSEFDFLYRQLSKRLQSAALSPAHDEGLMQAAVAIILRRHEAAAELLVIKRALSEHDHWSGHLALPGGRWEEGDRDLCATALRETHEEVGVEVAAGGEVLGRLETVRPRSPLAPRVAVTPFVSVAPPEYHVTRRDETPRALTLSDEVAAAFWVPVSSLKEGGRSEVFRMSVGGLTREWPAYPSEHGPIWGLTERILTDFLALVGWEGNINKDGQDRQDKRSDE